MPVCVGQEWEVAATEGGRRRLVVVGEVFAVAGVLRAPVVARGSTSPECPRVEALEAGELLHVPGGRTLEIARRWRQGMMMVEPPILYAAAEAEAAEDGLPDVGRRLRASRLYLHALTEAGGLTGVGGAPFDPCPVCGWCKDGSIIARDQTPEDATPLADEASDG